MRMGYVPKAGTGPISMPFWFGSGFHYAMEDYHGYKKHTDLMDAFNYYVEESKKAKALPVEWQDGITLARGMFTHYLNWWQGREAEIGFETVWVNGKPLVELEFHVPLGIGSDVTYSGVIDRVVRDNWGQLWLLDYKTAKVFDVAKLENDSQVSAYCWAAKTIFNLDVQGMVYFQFKKDFPSPPTLLKSGKFSTNKTQKTSYDLFKKSLHDLYAGTNRWRDMHPEYVDYLNYLAEQEGINYDRYIRLDYVTRNENHLQSVHKQIIAEAKEMIDPNLPIYPNPTKDCAWDCPFRAPCIAKDEGSDWQYLLDASFERRTIEDRNPYRAKESWDDPDAYLSE